MDTDRQTDRTVMCVNEAAHVQSRPVPALQVDLFREGVKISETRARQSPAFITHPLQLAQEQETCTRAGDWALFRL